MKARADQERHGNSTRRHRLQPSKPAWTHKVKPKHFVHVSLSDFQALTLVPRSNRFLPTGLEGLAGRRGECSPLDVWKGLTRLTRLWTEQSLAQRIICKLLLWKVWQRDHPWFSYAQCWVGTIWYTAMTTSACQWKMTNTFLGRPRVFLDTGQQNEYAQFYSVESFSILYVDMKGVFYILLYAVCSCLSKKCLKGAGHHWCAAH